MQLRDSVLWEARERELKAACWERTAQWTSTPSEPASTLRQIRAALFLGANLAISILPYRSLSAQSSHSGRQEERKMRGRRGNRNRQWGWSSVRVLSGGRRKLRHISRMKVNGAGDLQDDGDSVETKSDGETEKRREVISSKIIQTGWDTKGGRGWKDGCV